MIQEVNSDSEGHTTNSNQKRKVDSENYLDVEDEFSLSLLDSDTKEEAIWGREETTRKYSRKGQIMGTTNMRIVAH